MRRVPVLPTLAVLIAVGGMIALGIWQLRRAEWKDGLLAEYAANATRPPVAYPIPPRPDESLLYRPATGTCVPPIRWTVRAGHNRAGETGWRHIAHCANGLAADLGWSRNSAATSPYAGGDLSGALDWDRDAVFLLVSSTPAPGLAPSARPSPADIPNNHRGYAGQWFLFAGVALVIYVMALRQRAKLAGKAQDS